MFKRKKLYNFMFSSFLFSPQIAPVALWSVGAARQTLAVAVSLKILAVAADGRILISCFMHFGRARISMDFGSGLCSMDFCRCLMDCVHSCGSRRSGLVLYRFCCGAMHFYRLLKAACISWQKACPKTSWGIGSLVGCTEISVKRSTQMVGRTITLYPMYRESEYIQLTGSSSDVVLSLQRIEPHRLQLCMASNCPGLPLNRLASGR